ncbi:MAG: hypothetical protein RIQ81_363 [Pseudomonadota bacterium]|jgi:tetratricopeptide (TPR) repeat protein
MRLLHASRPVALTLLWTTVVSAAFAQAPATSLRKPAIEQGPPKVVDAVQGDVVRMKIQYTADSGRVQQVKWALRSEKSKSMICREGTCTLKTSAIKPGSYAIYVVVFDETGSDSIKFDFRLAAAPAKYTPKQVEVPLIKAGEDVKSAQTAGLPVTGQFVRSIEGRTYAHNRSQVRVVGTSREPLEKLDSIRTGLPGILHFSLTTQDEAWLLDNSLARIVRNSKGRAFVKLERGSLRVRTLRNIDKEWNVTASGYVFTGQSKQDTVVIRLPGDELLVASLRGITRVHKESKVKGEPDPGDFFTIEPGTMVRLQALTGGPTEDPGRPQPAGNDVEVDTVAKIIRKTTPFYLKARSNISQEGESFIQNRKPESLKAANDWARKAVAEDDAWLALESLLYRFDEAAKDPAACYLLGKSYLEIMLYPEAEEWLNRAIEAERTLKDRTMANDARLVLAELAYRRKLWDVAARHFDQADSQAIDAWIRDKARGQDRMFMIGKTCALSERRICAKKYLPTTALNDPRPEVRAEATNLIKKIPVLPGSTARFSLLAGYNSNIFSLKEPGSKDRPGDAPKNQDGIYTGKFHFDLRSGAHDAMPREEQTRFGLELQVDLEKSGFTTAKMNNFGRSHYDAHAGIFLTAASRPDKPTPSFDGSTYVYITTDGVGPQRVHDEAGGGVRVSVPFLLGLELETRIGRTIDPQPPLEQVLDPLTGEFIAASDDTGTIQRFRLHLVPVGPDSLTGEPRGKVQIALDATATMAKRAEVAGSAGDLTVAGGALTVSQKAVPTGVLAIRAGSEFITRDITEESAAELGTPQERMRTRVGVNYYHEVSQKVHIEVNTDYTIGTAQPESFDGFTRSTATFGLHLEF